jgi:hypothetical protein
MDNNIIREKMTIALKEYASKHNVSNRNDLFKPAIDSLELTPVQLKNKSSNSEYNVFRAIAGSIINELISAGIISLKTDEKIVERKTLTNTVNKNTERKKEISDFLTDKYLTNIEKADKLKNSKRNILKSIINDKNNEAIILNCTLDESIVYVESIFKKAAKISDLVLETLNDESFEFPNTLVGTSLRSQYEKYKKFTLGKISVSNYYSLLQDTVIDVISKNGGAFFEKLCLDLIKLIYNSNVIEGSDMIVGGPNDHGIDVEFKVYDNLGFEDKIVIQSKISVCGEKAVREFMGSMAFANVQKGIFMTTSVLGSTIKAFVKNAQHPACKIIILGRAEILGLMEKHSLGIKSDKLGNKVIDNEYFIV